MSRFWLLLDLMTMEVVVTTGAVRHANSSQNVTTSKPTLRFLQGGFLLVAKPTESKH